MKRILQGFRTGEYYREINITNRTYYFKVLRESSKEEKGFHFCAVSDLTFAASHCCDCKHKTEACDRLHKCVWEYTGDDKVRQQKVSTLEGLIHVGE